jgi:hypothetical protein
MFTVPLTRPADAGHPLPSGEGFAQKLFAIWTVVPELEITLDDFAWNYGIFIE